MTGGPTIAVIATYFGKLPDYFDLWLTSCRFNAEFDWLVFTDADWASYDIPPNVQMHRLTLSEFSRVVGQQIGIDLSISTPYKVCDFKPVYWSLLTLASRSYDFWGHCDLDMIFGRLSHFISTDLLTSFDKIFGVGHLTLYRNCDEANFMFQKEHPSLDWRDIMSDQRHRGFDEHIGVNRIWARHQGRVYENEAVIADLDPHVRRLELLNPVKNRVNQVFFFHEGRVLQGYYNVAGSWITNEFMYVHFQKRSMARRECGRHSSSFGIAYDGFYTLGSSFPNRSFVSATNPLRLSDFRREVPHRARRLMRHLRTRIST